MTAEEAMNEQLEAVCKRLMDIVEGQVSPRNKLIKRMMDLIDDMCDEYAGCQSCPFDSKKEELYREAGPLLDWSKESDSETPSNGGNE